MLFGGEDAALGLLGDTLATMAAEGWDPRPLAIIRLLSLTGCRRGEIASLKWSEIDLPSNCLRLDDSKTGQRIIPLGAAARAVLAELDRGVGAYVFPHQKSLDRPYQRLDRTWDEVCKRAGFVGVRVHDLRHSFASAGLRSGQSLVLIQKLLGHASISTTQRYAHLAEDAVQAAADRISASVSEHLDGNQPAPAEDFRSVS